MKKYGDPQGVLEAIAVYGSLLKIKEQVKSGEEELKKLNAASIDQKAKIENGKKELQSMAASTKAWEEVKELGFDKKGLSELVGITQKFGGPKAVFQAFKKYAHYEVIKNECAEAQIKLSTLQSDIVKRQSEYSSLTTAIDLCLKLLNDYHFGLDGIEVVLSAAQKYGESMKVLEAIVAYGKIQALVEEIGKQDGFIKASQQKIAELDGECKSSLERLQSLNALALQVGGEVNKVHGQAADNVWISQLLKLINDPYGADYGTHINAAMVLGRALKAFVIKHESNLKHRSLINDGLASLIADLGGVSDTTG
jgi:chromosome segregation ATPase